MAHPPEVLEKIRSDFPSSLWAEVAKALARYSDDVGRPEPTRVTLDILDLSRGDFDELVRLVDCALIDYRDILYWCEYYDDDPWTLWRHLVESLEASGYLTRDEAHELWHRKGAGFNRDDSLGALDELYRRLVERGRALGAEELDRLRTYGKRWKAKALPPELRKLTSR